MIVGAIRIGFGSATRMDAQQDEGSFVKVTHMTNKLIPTQWTASHFARLRENLEEMKKTGFLAFHLSNVEDANIVAECVRETPSLTRLNLSGDSINRMNEAAVTVI